LTKDFIPHPVIHSDSKNTFVPDKHQSPIEKASKDMSDKGYEEGYLADAIRTKMKRDNKRFWAGDNISDYVSEEMKHTLIDEATEAFELVLDRLLIDRETDPNSHGTARRSPTCGWRCLYWHYCCQYTYWS